MSKIKQTEVKKHMEPLSFMVCVVKDLAEYPKRRQAFQKTNNRFLTCRKPHTAATKDTVSR